MVCGANGPTGHIVQLVVAEEKNSETEIVTVLPLKMEELIVPDQMNSLLNVTM